MSFLRRLMRLLFPNGHDRILASQRVQHEYGLSRANRALAEMERLEQIVGRKR